ncbi:MAG: beta-lactamase family protein [Acidobacteriota bacterium]|nr:beta-lactamase family protein [Acidobacteriota bacterium]
MRLRDDVVPGTDWQKAAPESLGYASKGLEALRGWLKQQDTSSMILVVQGRVIFSYGDVSHTSKIASARKSVLSMLYGNYVASGKIDLDKTVAQLGLRDKQPFLPIEENATLRQLLASRSGIYLPTGSFGQKDYMPPRGSEAPGGRFVYNNWDFNAAGVAFEKLTGKNIYDALQTDLADPIGMQDYRRAEQVKDVRPETSFDEYVMRLSTRDMARLGLLMLNKGKWNSKQVIPANWVHYSTTLVTPFRDLSPSFLRNYGSPERWGYGAALWWVWDTPAYPGNVYTGPWQGAYTAMGAGGTFITVFPAGDMLMIHQVDIDKNPKASVSPSSYTAMIAMVMNSFCDESCP